MKLIIGYTWPRLLYNPLELFKDVLHDGKPIPLDHPKIHAYTSRLLECGISEMVKPKGSIVISLPTKVQSDLETWKKCELKNGKTTIVMIEFKAFQKKQSIDDADTSATF